MQDIALVVEGIEQVAQLVDAVGLGGIQQIGLSGHHVIRLFFPGLPQGLTGHVEGGPHQRVHLRPVRRHGAQQAVTDGVQVTTTVGVIDVVGGLAQFRLIVLAGGMDDTVLHFGAVHHQNHQHALTGQRQELHLPQRADLASWRRHQTGHAGQFRQSTGCLGHQLLRRLIRCQQLAQFITQLLVIRAAHGAGRQQRIHIEAIPTLGGHPARRSVGTDQQPQILQFRHDIADGRRAYRQAAPLGQGFRAHWLAVTDVTFHQGHE